MSAIAAPTRSRADLVRDLGWRRQNAIGVGVVLVAAILLPVVWRNDYVIDVALTALIWMILNQSWNLQLGIGGIWNFGQLAIFAIGAYVSALISIHWGLPVWLAMILGGLGAAVASLIIAVPALRLRGIYASLLTFSFGEVVRLLVISDDSGLTGGTFGLSGLPDIAFGDLSPDARQRAYYWLALAIVVATALVIWRFIHSPLGTALKALRDSPGYAAARGVSPMRMQIITFLVSAFIAGIAGAFYAHYFGVIAPSVMGLAPMALFVAMLVVGGLGTFAGPIVGTAVITVVSEYLRDFQEARLIIVGLILLGTIVIAPRGLVPAFGDAWRRVQRWMAEDETEEGNGATAEPTDEPSEAHVRVGRREP
ncbi:MAG: branched-chain amino acid ABC transporter permease [Actinomycetota bacterium]